MKAFLGITMLVCLFAFAPQADAAQVYEFYGSMNIGPCQFETKTKVFVDDDSGDILGAVTFLYAGPCDGVTVYGVKNNPGGGYNNNVANYTYVRWDENEVEIPMAGFDYVSVHEQIEDFLDSL